MNPFPDPTTPSQPSIDPPQTAPPAPRRRGDRLGGWIAWCVILGSVGLIFGSNLYFSLAKPASVSPRAPGSPPSVAVGAKKDHDPTRGHGSADAASVSSVELTIAGRSAIGSRSVFEIFGLPKTPGTAAANARQIRELAVSPLDKVRAAPVLAELGGKEAAMAELDEVSPPTRTDLEATPSDQDVRSLRVIYDRGPDALDEASKQLLIRRHGWFGRLAVSWGKPDSDPVRQAALAPARRAAAATIGMVFVMGFAGIAGLILAIITIVLYSQGRLRSVYAPSAVRPPFIPALQLSYPPHFPVPPPGYPFQPAPGAPSSPYPPAYATAYASPYAGAFAPSAPGAVPHLGYFAPPPPPPSLPSAIPGEPPTSSADLDGFATAGPVRGGPVRGGPFVEAFAVYIGGMMLVGLLLHRLVRNPTFAWQWVAALPVVVAILWPRWRGVGKAEWKRALGWHAGRGFFREIGAGVVGYLASIPLLFAGMLVMMLLNKLAGAHPTHPIQGDVGRGTGATVQIYLLACVFAPIAEETMFRGALFHHLRRFGKGWSWLPSAALVALLFAAIHPQGWTFIPALGSLAVAFAGLREWRGSILASMTAHFIQNFVVVTMLVLMVS